MKKLCTGIVVAVLLLPAVSCAPHRIDAQRNHSSIPVTPWEKVLVVNAELSLFNNGLARGVIAANNAGVLDAATTEAITTEQFHIAAIKTELDNILSQGQAAAELHADQIKILIGSMSSSITRLISSGNVGIKNKQNAAELVAEIQGVSAAVENLINLLKQIGVLK